MEVNPVVARRVRVYERGNAAFSTDAASELMEEYRYGRPVHRETTAATLSRPKKSRLKQSRVAVFHRRRRYRRVRALRGPL